MENYVYCGRPTIYSNPYTHIKDKKTLASFIVDSREESILKYREYFEDKIKNDPKFKQEILKLKDCNIGCFCAPQACHLDIIAEYLNNL